METPLTGQPDLRFAIQALWRRRWLFLAIVIALPVAVYIISSIVPKTYEASAIIRVKPSNVDITGLPSQSFATTDTEALLVQTPRVAKAAAEQLGSAEAPGTIDGTIRATPVTTPLGGTTEFLRLTAQADGPAKAAALANAYAAAVDQVRTGDTLKQIDHSLAELQVQADQATDPTSQAQIEQQMQELRTARATQSDSTQTVEPAHAPDSPVSPHPKRNTGLAAVAALLIGLGAVTFAERLDRRLREASDLETLLGAPLLSVVPRGAFPGEPPAPGPVQESFRTLSSSLLYFNVDRPLATILVASPTKGDGKTTVALHLAVALARDGQDVVLVDCDLRHPQVALRLGIEPRYGVAEVLTEQASLREALVDVQVGDGRLRALAAGRTPPNPTRLLGSLRMDAMLSELAEMAGIVVVDTAPLLNVSDAVPLLQLASGTVVVAKVGTTSRDALLRLRQVVETARGTLLGGVATGSRAAGLYGYGAEYYGPDTEEARKAADVEARENMPEALGPEVRLPAAPGAAQPGPPATAGKLSAYGRLGTLRPRGRDVPEAPAEGAASVSGVLEQQVEVRRRGLRGRLRGLGDRLSRRGDESAESPEEAAARIGEAAGEDDSPGANSDEGAPPQAAGPRAEVGDPAGDDDERPLRLAEDPLSPVHDKDRSKDDNGEEGSNLWLADLRSESEGPGRAGS